MLVVSAVSFLTPAEVAQLAAQTGVSQSSTLVKRQAQQLGFLQALGARIGFPQRTVATAQLLLLRFHLFYSPKEFVAHEVAIACMAVAAKINDTPKKAREIILSSWALRYPDLVRSAAPPPPPTPSAINRTTQSAVSGVKNASGVRTPASPAVHGAGGASTPRLGGSAQQHALGIISESDVDAGVLEKERKRVVSIESLVLQSIAFNFNVHVPNNFRFAIKIARKWNADKVLAKLVWQTTADCHRTYAPLCYPPATIALASVYCAALLQCKAGVTSDVAREIVARMRGRENDDDTIADEVETTFRTTTDSVEEVVHSLLDLYLAAVSTLTSIATSTGATPISPATPASPAEPLGPDYGGSVDGRQSSSSSTSRKLPPHAYAPPPYGLLFCLSSTAESTDGATSTATGIGSGLVTDIAADLTQIKIDLRQEEDKRRTRAATRRDGEPLRIPHPAAAAMLVRPFDKGGVVGDVDQVMSDDPIPAAAGGVVDLKDTQYASLQRFLF